MLTNATPQEAAELNLLSRVEQQAAQLELLRDERAELQHELEQTRAEAAFLRDDLLDEKSTRLFLARSIRALLPSVQQLTGAKTDLEKLVAASLLARAVTNLQRATESLCNAGEG